MDRFSRSIIATLVLIPLSSFLRVSECAPLEVKQSDGFELSNNNMTRQARQEDALEAEPSIWLNSIEYAPPQPQSPLRLRLRGPTPIVGQDIYNFYNVNPRPNTIYNIHDDDYDQRPLYRQPYYERPPYSPYLYPPLSSTTTTTTTTTASPLAPIGYMLIDAHHTPVGSYSKPIAFYRSKWEAPLVNKNACCC